MEQRIFDLISDVSCEGLDTGEWGFLQDFNTSDWFGTDVDRDLDGHYLYIYLEEDECLSFVKEEPFLVLPIREDGIEVLLFKLD